MTSSRTTLAQRNHQLRALLEEVSRSFAADYPARHQLLTATAAKHDRRASITAICSGIFIVGAVFAAGGAVVALGLAMAGSLSALAGVGTAVAATFVMSQLADTADGFANDKHAHRTQANLFRSALQLPRRDFRSFYNLLETNGVAPKTIMSFVDRNTYSSVLRWVDLLGRQAHAIRGQATRTTSELFPSLDHVAAGRPISDAMNAHESVLAAAVHTSARSQTWTPATASTYASSGLNGAVTTLA